MLFYYYKDLNVSVSESTQQLTEIGGHILLQQLLVVL